MFSVNLNFHTYILLLLGASFKVKETILRVQNKYDKMESKQMCSDEGFKKQIELKSTENGSKLSSCRICCWNHNKSSLEKQGERDMTKSCRNWSS